jgi:glutamate/tyrosine decarboxylase-like PLP-dependent enzyme
MKAGTQTRQQSPDTASAGERISRVFFPGPESENETWARDEFENILDDWFRWRRERFPGDPGIDGADASGELLLFDERRHLRNELNALIDMLRAEVPTYSPRYIGHMMSELSLPSLLGHFAALLHNPNNTSREASKVGSVIEREAIAMLARMVGYNPSKACGHFTSGGTVANFEGVWRARYRLDHWLSLGLRLAEAGVESFSLPDAAHMGWARFEELCLRYQVRDTVLRQYSAVAGNPADVNRRISRALGHDYLGPVVLVPGNKHFSWRKAANVFGLGEDSFWSVALDSEGRLDVRDLAERIDTAAREKRPILMVVSVAGTTETGEIDPIDSVTRYLSDLELKRGWRIWHHVDAAYGGFLCSLLGGESGQTLTKQSRAALAAIRCSDSITVDPHKLGFVPYACGAFLTRNGSNYAVSSFEAPYLDRDLPGTDKWSCTLEGSRPASGAAATWLTGRAIGFSHERFGALLASTIAAARHLVAEVSRAIPAARFLKPIETNIVCFSIAKDGEALTDSNERTARIFDAIQDSQRFWVSRTVLGNDYELQKRAHIADYGGIDDGADLVLIRCVLMNPYWTYGCISDALIPEFVALLGQALRDADRPALDNLGQSISIDL